MGRGAYPVYLRQDMEEVVMWASLEEVQQKHPEVNANGFVTNEAHSPVNEKQFALAQQWLFERTTQQVRYNNKRTSYGLKHDAERWHVANGTGLYLSNGAFISAAISMGYKVRRISDTPNAVLNIRINK